MMKYTVYQRFRRYTLLVIIYVPYWLLNIQENIDVV